MHLQFTDKDGNTLDTIIIAGENGCGKTVLLNELYELSFNNFTQKKNYILRLELELSKAEQDSINEREVIAKVYPDGIPNIIEAIVDYIFSKESIQTLRLISPLKL